MSATVKVEADACTDFVLKSTDDVVVAARSMEFGAPLNSQLVLHPRGEALQSTAPEGKHGFAWTSKYGYIALNAFGQPLAADGMNEVGLSAGLLWQPGAKYPDVSDAEVSKALQIELIAEWILGNFATVQEVKDGLKSVIVYGDVFPPLKQILPIHVSVHDAQGNNLVIEFTDGHTRVYDNPNGVLTNSPTFEWHISNLGNYTGLSPDGVPVLDTTAEQITAPGLGGGWLGVPGDWSPPSRFIRASFFKAYASPVTGAPATINLAEHILNTVDIPYGDVVDTPGKTRSTTTPSGPWSRTSPTACCM